MSSTYDHYDSEASESFETLHILDHEDLEDNRPPVGPVVEHNGPISNLRNGLGGIHEMPMPGVKCPRCAERGYEQWVLPGKHCPRCNQPC